MNSLLIGILLQVMLISPLLGQLVVIDPGHGYCTKPSCTKLNPDKRTDLEIKTNLAVALKLKKILTDSTNWEVFLTRETDEWLSVDSRRKLANDLGADYFLSIHCNAGGGTGTETFWCKETSVSESLNKNFAFTIASNFVLQCSCSNRRIVEDHTYLKNPETGNNFHLGVLKENLAVSCLSEIGFVDHPQDKNRLEDDNWRQTYALAYYHALKKVIK
jgi:N-acetylmuramoyl-L-alanine amidase